MDAEIQEALTTWLAATAREMFGPDGRGESERWRGSPEQWKELFDKIDPALWQPLWAALQTLPYPRAWHDVWPLLPDHIIGTLMKAGATDYLPSVVVVEEAL